MPMTEVNSAENKSPNEIHRDKILETLSELGKQNVTDDALIFEGTKMILPAHFNNNVDDVISYLRDYKQRQGQSFSFSREFPYKPWDGAAAFERAMKRVFGTIGIGAATMTFFGPIPPERRTVEIGPNEKLQIPWGRVAFTPLEAEFYLSGIRHSEYGVIFQLNVEAPLRYRSHIEGFFSMVEDELKSNSIYRGKAFAGTEDPQFMDTESFDPSRVIYNEDVFTQLDVNMWSLLRYSDIMRQNHIPLKRSILVEGPYGTGKTLAGQLTAKQAVENGWTFVLARPGKDDLGEVLKVAQLYAPAVVWYEDIDVIARGHDDVQISKLLDSLDGITNKGVEILAGFTTNHVDKIQKGILRPGRLDAVINIGALDENGIEKLCKVTLPGTIQGNIDYHMVGKAFDGMLPAFIKEGIDRAMRYSIARNGGQPGMIETDDLVNSAKGLENQLNLMNDAKEGVTQSALDREFHSVIKRAVNGTKVVDDEEEEMYKLSVQ